MTDQERQELRDWSAKLMGYWIDNHLGQETYFREVKYNKNFRSFVCFVKDWAPDFPFSPASQIFSVVERLRELGWALHFHNRVDNKDMGVGFSRELSSFHNLGLYQDDPCLAILLAAKATEEKP